MIQALIVAISIFLYFERWLKSVNCAEFAFVCGHLIYLRMKIDLSVDYQKLISRSMPKVFHGERETKIEQGTKWG